MSGSGTAPYWVKLTRTADFFTGSVFPDGVNWTVVGSVTQALPSSVYVGLLQASNVYATLATATFDNVSISGVAGDGAGGGGAPAAVTGVSAVGGVSQVTLAWNNSPRATSYTVYRGNSPSAGVLLNSGIPASSYVDTSVINGTTYYYQVFAVNSSGASGPSNEARATPAADTGTAGGLPLPWLSQDVGSTSPTGRASYAGGIFTLQGSGNGAYFVPDTFQFAYQPMSGDCSIVARVATQSNSDPFAHAGVIIRDSLDKNSGFAEMTLLPDNGGAYFQYRTDAGSPNGMSGSGTAPYWIKLTRTADLFTGSVSPDGLNWTVVVQLP